MGKNQQRQRAPTKNKRAPARKNGVSITPKALPRVSACNTKPATQSRARRAATKAKELADRDVKATHVLAGVGGLGASVYASSYIVDNDWLSPEMTAAVLSVAGVGAAYAGYRYDKPHLMWGAAGWTAGSVSHGWMAYHLERKYEKKLKAASSAKPRNAYEEPDDGRENDIAERARLTAQRTAELEQQLAEARARLTPELELVAA